jgi:hypothetical protein
VRFLIEETDHSLSEPVELSLELRGAHATREPAQDTLELPLAKQRDTRAEKHIENEGRHDRHEQHHPNPQGEASQLLGIRHIVDHRLQQYDHEPGQVGDGA